MSNIAIAKIRQDGGTQPRAQINLFTVGDYAEEMRAGVRFPDVVLFFDGSDYWLADGFHRVLAAIHAGLEAINADVRQGTLDDARWHSYGANATHGLRRTNEDKRLATESALQHPYASKYSDEQIALHVGVHRNTVLNYRNKQPAQFVQDTRIVNRNGTTYEMDTANIGKVSEILVKHGEDEILQAAREIRLKRLEEDTLRREIIKAQPVIVPAGKFPCIVIDPPWPMEKIERDERPNQFGFDYPTMSEDELKAWPHIHSKAAANCHLYMWTTHKFLPMALRVVEHWGFNYQCLMTWVKNVGMTPYSWMYSTEHVLFCRRGYLSLEKLGLRLDFQAKVREHSRKPEEFYELVRQVSPGPRLDVFSREVREGFEQLGNEIEKFQEVGA